MPVPLSKISHHHPTQLSPEWILQKNTESQSKEGKHTELKEYECPVVGKTMLSLESYEYVYFNDDINESSCTLLVKNNYTNR